MALHKGQFYSVVTVIMNLKSRHRTEMTTIVPAFPLNTLEVGIPNMANVTTWRVR